MRRSSPRRQRPSRRIRTRAAGFRSRVRTAGSGGTVIAVLIAAPQLLLNRRQARAGFEDAMSLEYRKLVVELLADSVTRLPIVRLPSPTRTRRRRAWILDWAPWRSTAQDNFNTAVETMLCERRWLAAQIDADRRN
jgi:ribosomal protein L34